MTQPQPPSPGAPAGPAHDPERAPLATSAAGQAAAAFVLALSKAARSFTLYDPGNAVVRQFLADYQRKAEAVTAAGALVVEVLPFDLLREGEAVYREEDRERSLAFRLFRDGVRRLTFQPGLPWSELLHFLQLMAIRATGIRQQEEDLVTMLRKAEFSGISFAAVEGFTPEEDNPEPAEQRRRAGQGAATPAGFDTPFPLLPPPGPITYREVGGEALAPLRAEEGPETLAPHALRLAALLLQEAGRGGVAPREAQQFLCEVRDFLIADGALAALAALADLAGRQPAGPLRDDLLRALGDARVLEAVVAAVPPGSMDLPPEAARLLPLVPAEAALDLLAGEADPARRHVLLHIAESRLPADADVIVARLAALEPQAARALIQAIVARAPDRAAAAAAALLEHRDHTLQVEALRAMEAAEGEVPLERLLRLLHADQEPVRIAAAQVLERRGQAAAFPAVQEALTARKGLSHEEASALGRALCQLHPARAAELFAEWLRPRKGLLGRLAGGGADESLQWAAVAGLGAHPAPEAVSQLEAVAKGADEALRRHCFATLARRRHQAAQGVRHG
ncbi:MAG: hypothetical protein IPO09_15995 [Anaeromyxobacter sp.]|nr:hypothetical protein [Anaeromyxobacter sp.]MBL0276138.1 hypothetical protein [Anaeromyxobacter sp.]